MSITTYGFGSGYITTAGFGGYYEEILDLIPKMAATWLFEARDGPALRERIEVVERAYIELLFRLRPAMDQIPLRIVGRDSIPTRERDE